MKATVIYIMGEGRSGSTLLDLLLSNQKSLFGTGELWTFFEEDYSVQGFCSCGHSVSNCEFWSSVKNELTKKYGDEILLEHRKLREIYDKTQWLPFRLLGMQWNNFSKYCNQLTSIFDIISALSNKKFIIDSSKQIGRAYNLLVCPEINVKLIHLVRDGRGVIWSRKRDFIRNPNLDRAFFRKSTVYNSFIWLTKNYFAKYLQKKFPTRYLLVRYEEFVKTPQVELIKISKFCGFDYTYGLVFESDQYGIKHQIGGNLRTRSNKDMNLNLDDEWISKLSNLEKNIFWIISGKLARQLGYKRINKNL